MSTFSRNKQQTDFFLFKVVNVLQGLFLHLYKQSINSEGWIFSASVSHQPSRSILPLNGAESSLYSEALPAHVQQFCFFLLVLNTLHFGRFNLQGTSCTVGVGSYSCQMHFCGEVVLWPGLFSVQKFQTNSWIFFLFLVCRIPQAVKKKMWRRKQGSVNHSYLL